MCQKFRLFHNKNVILEGNNFPQHVCAVDTSSELTISAFPSSLSAASQKEAMILQRFVYYLTKHHSTSVTGSAINNP
jgi:hypothetical protein